MPSGRDILEIFEDGQRLHPVDRGLLLLARAHPEISLDDLETMTLGRRDASLLRFRSRLFGNQLEACTQCPRCEERVQLDVLCDELLVESAAASAHAQLRLGAIELTVRAPDSRDLAAVAAARSVDEVRAVLLDRCVTEDVEVDRLSEADRITISDAIGAADPNAETLIALSCPSCGHEWQVAFQIVSFLWDEIAAEARRLIREVDVLARTYGWSEAEILELSDTRRRLYLEMALS